MPQCNGVQFKKELEAHFVCAILNSAPAVAVPLCYTTDITTHILKVIGIPQFNPSNPIHTHLAELSQQAHRLAAAGQTEVSETSEVSGQLAAVEAQVDEAAAELWGITDRELEEIRRSLEELG
jgi:hypothetical protein